MTLLILGLPIIDTFIVIGQRFYEGRPLFRPDSDHIHHKLLAVGLDHYEAVLVIYIAQTLLVTSAFVFRFESDFFVKSLFAGILLSIVGGLRYAKAVGWSAHDRNSNEPRTSLGVIVKRLRKSDVLSSYPGAFIAASIPVYLLYAISSTGQIPVDGVVSVYVVFAFALLWMSLYRSAPKFHMHERIVVYIVATVSLYCWHTTDVRYHGLYSFENFYFFVLTISVVLAYRFSQSRQFTVTPTDFLVIFLAVIAPSFVGSVISDGNIVAIGSKTVILFYAVELLAARIKGRELLF